MPGPNRSQGFRRAGQSRVGQPRDQDGRPQSGAERRGGRTYKPGLHDWSPGASARPGERQADGAQMPGRLARPGRPTGRDDVRAPARPGRPPFGRQGVGPGAGPRTGTESGSGFARSPLRLGSMGGGSAALSSAGSESRRDDRQPGSVRNAAPRPGQGRPWQSGAASQVGPRAAKTRFGSEEPRDNGDRSRYRTNTSQPGPRQQPSSRGFRDEQGAPDGNRAERPIAAGSQPGPARRSTLSGRRPQFSGPARSFDPSTGNSTRRASPAQPGGKRPYADLDVVESDHGRDHLVFRDVTHEVVAPPAAESAAAPRRRLTEHRAARVVSPAPGQSAASADNPARTDPDSTPSGRDTGSTDENGETAQKRVHRRTSAG